MGRITVPGNPPIDVTTRRSARARRMSLRVSRLDGRVTLTLPRWASDREGRAFLDKQADWITRAQAEGLEPVIVGDGVLLPVEGEILRVTASRARGARRSDGVLEAPSRATGLALRAWLIELARDRIADAADKHAATLGVSYGRLTLRDTRSRWGSCSAEGNLMLSWRLIFAPPEILDYVVAHEVAHLIEMNHSAAFWARVAEICPEYQAPRKWLRSEGHALHRYRFD